MLYPLSLCIGIPSLSFSFSLHGTGMFEYKRSRKKKYSGGVSMMWRGHPAVSLCSLFLCCAFHSHSLVAVLDLQLSSSPSHTSKRADDVSLYEAERMHFVRWLRYRDLNRYSLVVVDTCLVIGAQSQTIHRFHFCF